jgi:hypothetical protein
VNQAEPRRIEGVAMLTAVLLVVAVGVRYPVVEPPTLPASAPVAANTTDAKVFAAVVERLRAGEGYYAAMGSELRAHYYPTRSPFNWRTPLHLSALALAPWALWRAVLTALLVALYVSVMLVVKVRPAASVANALTLGLLVALAAQDAIFVSEVWAGVLVGLSVCAFAGDQRPLGIGFALAALFVRELAAPYLVACTLIAFIERRWRDVGALMVGALVYATYYGWHVGQVHAHRTLTDLAHPGSWLTLPGVPFLQATLLKLGWLSLLPPWTSTIALGLLAAGLIADGTPRHARVGSVAFAGFFLAAGFPFNDYWGFLAAPVWAVTCGYGAGAIASALKDLTASSSAPA